MASTIPSTTTSSQQSSEKITPNIPLDQDVMQLARLGEIGAIQKLFDSGTYDATYKDEQGITPLHWAALKNHYALCHFLIQTGADVNAKGGDVMATPAHWAARSCNYYIVDLLLNHGADPLKTDDQGFNLLQNATMDGNVYQLLMLLQQEIPVDVADSQGHTSLMWAAYKGYPPCVDILLQWGASVNATDNNGFTALHWALVKGSTPCIQKLIEYGSDRFATTADGKTPAVCAKEMNSTSQWRHALGDCGFNANGTQKHDPLSSWVKDRKLFFSRLFFLWPFFILFCSFHIASGMPIFVGLPVSLGVFVALQWLSTQLLPYAPSNMRNVHHTPFLAGIFAGSLFWVAVQWIRKLLYYTFFTHPFYNLLFAISLTSCTYFYFRSMFEDPGYIPKSASRSEQKSVVTELIESQTFDERHFCMTCKTRKPLRSKHCKRCGRCVAKQDHHCPWVNNCVANNNHRHFLYYILSLASGVIIFVWLTIKYLEILPSSRITQCNFLSSASCDALNKDPFTITVTIWAALQLTWVTMLMFVQLVQISRGLTTRESMKSHDHHSSGPTTAITSALAAGTTTLDSAQITEAGSGPDLPTEPVAKPKESSWQALKKLLGLDTFLATAMFGSRGDVVLASQRQNLFTRGVITNCSDFFLDPAPVFGSRENGEAMLGGQKVDYTRMWEVPSKTKRTAGEDMRYEALAVDSV